MCLPQGTRCRRKTTINTRRPKARFVGVLSWQPIERVTLTYTLASRHSRNNVERKCGYLRNATRASYFIDIRAISLKGCDHVFEYRLLQW